MKKFIILLFCFVSIRTGAQDLSYITFSGASDLSSFAFRTDDGLIIKISDDGRLLEWGLEMEKWRYNYYPGKLQQYTGRVDYYGSAYDSIMRGKVSVIGSVAITYYGATEKNEKRGKIRTIGRVLIDYFDNFDNQLLRGRIRSAGTLNFNYYSTYDDNAYKGKLKTVGTNNITYYSSFDDRLIRGKIKTIGGNTLYWYTSHDSGNFQGGLKSGNLMPVVNGVTYILM